MSDVKTFLDGLLERVLAGPAQAWYAKASAEIAAGVTDDRFCLLISSASRHGRGGELGVTADDVRRAGELVPGWNPERWTRLKALRAGLILARPDLDGPGTERAIAEAFKFADEGELCALYATLPLLPGPERFVWQAGEGCRTNMLTVFESVACDTPYPVEQFDDVAWKQCVVKAIFVGAPLWRVHGLDGRLSADLARMALDLADERRSAGRDVQPELWLCLGEHVDDRALVSLQTELVGEHAAGRAAAGYALARAGTDTARTHLTSALERERDPFVRSHHERALAGETGQRVFGELELAPAS